MWDEIKNIAITGFRKMSDQDGIDSVTNTLQTINYEHHEIHSGSSFIACDVQNISTTTLKWMIVTPSSTKYAHIVFDINCTGEITTLITEGADRVAGTPLTVINRNRVGTPADATVTVSRSPTDGSTDGTVTLLHLRLGATGVGNKTLTSGGNRGINEYVLKPNTKYIVSCTTYADVYVSMCLDWYEHQNKN